MLNRVRGDVPERCDGRTPQKHDFCATAARETTDCTIEWHFFWDFLRKLLKFCDFFNVKLFVNYKICWNLDSSLVLGSEVYRAVEKAIQNLFITHVFNQAGVGPDSLEQM